VARQTGLVLYWRLQHTHDNLSDVGNSNWSYGGAQGSSPPQRVAAHSKDDYCVGRRGKSGLAGQEARLFFVPSRLEARKALRVLFRGKLDGGPFPRTAQKLVMGTCGPKDSSHIDFLYV
jgi:hypothetical protein